MRSILVLMAVPVLSLSLTSAARGQFTDPSMQAMPAFIQYATPPEAVEMWRASATEPRALLPYLDHASLRKKLVAQLWKQPGMKEVVNERPVIEKLLLLHWLAVERLGDVGGADVVPALESYAAERASAGNADAATQARLSVERIRLRAQGREVYVQAMIQWVETPKPPPGSKEQAIKDNWQRVIEGARALGVLRVTEAVPALIRRHQTTQKSPLTDFFLVRCLARIGDRRALDVLEEEVANFANYAPAAGVPLEPGEPDVAWAYWQMRTQGMTQERAIEEMIRSWTEGRGNLRADRMLEWIGRPAVPALVAALVTPLQGPDPLLSQYMAARALGNLKAPEAVGPLRDLLRNGQSTETRNIRSVAARALGQIGDRSALPELMEAATDPNLLTRNAAVAALGALGDKQAENLLLRLVQEDEDPNIRYVAANALATCGTAAIVPALQARLAVEPKEGVRGALRTTIRKLSGQ